mgnify:CR=1 FL=1
MDENKVVDQAVINEDELFHFVEYNAEAAEKIGYPNYSYWGSVFTNFLKRKSAVFMSMIFFGLVIFSFIALAIGKYNYAELVTDSSLAFISPNAEYWFGTDNLGRDVWSRVWFGIRTSLFIGCSIAKQPVEKMVKGFLPFYFSMLVLLLLLTFIPELTLSLPRFLGLL